MGNKYFEGKVTNKKVSGEVDEAFITSINALDGLVTAKMDELQVADAITEIFNVLRASNKYIDDTMPWALAKDESQQDRLETVLYHLLESIRVCGSMLESFMPDTSASILSQINNNDKTYAFNDNNSYELGQPSALFQRIDRDKFIAENNLEV